MSYEEKQLFDEDDAKWLASLNELSPSGPHSFHIRLRLFQTRSINDPTPSLDTADDKIISVPKVLYSTSTLQILGFSATTAHDRFQTWNNMDPGLRDNFGDFFRMTQDWLEYQDMDAIAPSDDWDGVMRSLGITEQLRQAILKPGFDEIRLTQSAVQWVKLGMKMRCEALLDGYDASRE